jgi:hypothetical protein
MCILNPLVRAIGIPRARASRPAPALRANVRHINILATRIETIA